MLHYYVQAIGNETVKQEISSFDLNIGLKYEMMKTMITNPFQLKILPEKY